MKTLRLILWRDCPRSCENCVNRTLPPQEKFGGYYDGYDEIVLTGGEPLLYPDRLFSYIAEIRQQTDAPIYVYTAMASVPLILSLLEVVDGVTLTIHERGAYRNVPKLTEEIMRVGYEDKSLRLNSFVYIPISKEIDKVWKWSVRDYDPDCQVPENETVLEVLL